MEGIKRIGLASLSIILFIGGFIGAIIVSSSAEIITGERIDCVDGNNNKIEGFENKCFDSKKDIGTEGFLFFIMFIIGISSLPFTICLLIDYYT
jgi:hypothetical protein